MALTYHNRNIENISKLADHTKAAALKWLAYLVANDVDILIYCTIRTEDEQRRNVLTGASRTMKSYHLVGQALDFVPVKDGKSDWKGYECEKVKKAIAYAKKLGFEWGGDWKSFVDKPHLQFNYKGYGTDTFGQLVDPEPKQEVKSVVNKPGPIGKITILKKINLWKRVGNKLEKIRILQPNEEYRVYGYDDLHGGQYNVGGGCWITKMDGHLKYQEL